MLVGSLAPTAAAGTAAAAGGGLLSTLAIGSQIAAPLLGGMAASQAAKGEKMRAQANAEIGRTRAAQTDTVARENLNSELATLRTTLATNAQPINAGTAAMFNELRRTRGRERRIETGSRMQEAADWSMQAQNAGASGRNALLGGLIRSAPSMFDLYDMRRR
jgi:hypothetical protein